MVRRAMEDGTVELAWRTPQFVKVHTPKGERFKTEQDRVFGSRQMSIDSLSPKERKAQDKWAKKQIEALYFCPDTFVRKKGGYLCAGNIHWVSDEFLASGKMVDPKYFGPYVSKDPAMILKWENTADHLGIDLERFL
jgi:hypothetical protein